MGTAWLGHTTPSQPLVDAPPSVLLREYVILSPEEGSPGLPVVSLPRPLEASIPGRLKDNRLPVTIENDGSPVHC